MKKYSVTVIVAHDIHIADDAFPEGAMFSYPTYAKSGRTCASNTAKRYRIVVEAENKEEAFQKANDYILKATCRESDNKSGRFAWAQYYANIEAIPHYRLLADISSYREDLRDFTPELEYPLPEGAKPVSKEVRQRHIGVASNLIGVMRDRYAPLDDIVSALKYYLVAINTGCDNLDIKAAEKDLGIKELVMRYKYGR